MKLQPVLLFSGLIVIAVLVLMIALSWSTTVPSSTMSTLKVDTTAEAKVTHERAVEPTVSERSSEDNPSQLQGPNKLGASGSAKGEQESGTETESETHIAAGPVELTVSAVGETLAFDASSFFVRPGVEVTLTLNNPSSNNQHNLVIVQADTKDAVAADGIAAGPTNDWVTPDDNRVIANTALINPGGSGDVTFTAPSAGTYQFVCTFPGHSFTMFGDFHVSKESSSRGLSLSSPTPTNPPTPRFRPTTSAASAPTTPTKGYRLFINGSPVKFGFTSIGISGGILQVDAPNDYVHSTYSAGSAVKLIVSPSASGSQVRWSGVDSHTDRSALVNMVNDRYVDVEAEGNRKIILIQGLGGSSSRDLYTSGGDLGGHRSRLLSYFQDYQADNAKLLNNNVWLEKEDVIGFSYSDRYWDVVEEKSVRGQEYPTNRVAVADYEGSDTCPGVHQAAQKLDALINNLTSQKPDVQIDIIAHSMGGLVAAYWVSNQDSEYLKQYVRSVTTLDSPLEDGHPISSSITSGCSAYDQATEDLLNHSDVLKKINQYENTTHRIPFFHVNSTLIGDLLPRGNDLGQPCGGVNAPVFGMFGAIIGSIFTGGLLAPALLAGGASYLGGDGLEHSCVWTSPDSHELIAKNVIFKEQLTLPVKDWAEEHFTEGKVYYADDSYELAEKEFTTAISLDPDVAVYYAARGSSRHKLGRYLQAVDDFDNAVRLTPSVAEFYGLRGRSNYRWGKYQSAKYDFETATSLAPNEATYFADLGVVHYKLGNFTLAVTNFDQAIQIAPEQSEYHRLRGISYRDLSLYEKAMEDLNKSIEITPDRSLTYGSRGLLYYRLGQYQLAIADYDKALQLNPNEARAYEGKGDAFRELGQAIKANASYAAACDINNAYCSYIPVPMPSPTPWPTGVPATIPKGSVGATAATLDIDVNGDSLQFNRSEMFADAGTEVVVNFNNSSSINSHNWALVENGTKDAVAADGVGSGPASNWLPEGDSRILGNTILLGPGQSGTATFTAPSAGTYQFVCTFPGHNFTMFGDFTVTPVSTISVDVSPTGVPAEIPHPYGTGKLGIYRADYRDATIRGQLLTQDPIPNSAADAWGLQSGDVIILINDEPVETTDQLSGVFAGLSGGDVVKIKFLRDENLYEGEVSLGAYHYETVGAGDEKFLNYSLLPGETLAYHFWERDGNAVDFSVIGPDGDSVVGLVLDDKSTGQFQASQSGTYRMRFGNQSAWFDTKEIYLWYRITP